MTDEEFVRQLHAIDHSAALVRATVRLYISHEPSPVTRDEVLRCLRGYAQRLLRDLDEATAALADTSDRDTGRCNEPTEP